MYITRKYPCKIRLHEINDGMFSPPLHRVTLEMFIIPKSISIFVVFNFNSIDDEWIYLKNLTRKCGNYAVEKLFQDFYPATIELAENFEFVSKFGKLLLSDETVWPSDKIPGFILQD